MDVLPPGADPGREPPVEPCVDYRTVFQVTPHPAVLLTADPEFRVLDVNSHYLEATGTQRSVLVGRSLFEAFPADPNAPACAGQEELLTSLLRVLRDRVRDVMGIQRYDIPRTDGQAGFLVRYWSPVNTPVPGPDGHVACVIHQVLDATEWVLAQEQAASPSAMPPVPTAQEQAIAAELIRRSSEAKASNQSLKSALEKLGLHDTELWDLVHRLEELSLTKSAFLANMSHEIRTPLTAILGLTQVVLDSELKPQQLDYLKKVQTSARSLLGIINQVLDYSRLEAGRLEMEAIDFSLDDVLEGTTGLFTGVALEKDVELVFEVEPGTTRGLNGDPLRLGQVLNNLVGNALKFTQQGEVRVRVRELAANADEITLEFTVADTGIGIPADRLEGLFQPFTQCDPSTTRLYGGTGLGLAIARRLVGQMGGSLQVRSSQGRGSQFTFTVCLRPAREPASPGTVGDGRPRTLVVDDHQSVLEALGETLEGWGFPVHRAGSAAEALEAIRDRTAAGMPFELYFLDWKMPVMDGLDLARHIQGQETGGEGASIVIMVTAHGRQTLPKMATGVRIDGVLEKPFTASSLLHLLASLRPGRREAPCAADPFHRNDLLRRTATIQGARVLVVEDNEANQIVAGELLARMGLVVDLAASGREALDLLGRTAYAAVLMDLQMPEMDGYEAARRIHALPGLAELPVIAMTAANLVQDRQASAAAGMLDHVAKPIDIHELAGVLCRRIRPRAGAPESPPEGPRPDPQLSVSGTPPTPAGATALDLDTALQRVGGDPGTLDRVVKAFLRDFSATAATLDLHLAAGARDVARQLLHTLKGLAATLGAFGLQEQAQCLEAELMGGVPLKAKPAFERELANTVATLAREFGPGAVPPVLDRPPLPARVLVTSLGALLARSAYVPTAFQAELHRNLEGKVSEAVLDDLITSLRTFQYSRAARLAEQVLLALPVDAPAAEAIP